MWGPEHTGIERNETFDHFAKEGTGLEFNPKLLCGTPTCFRKWELEK